MMYFPAHWPGSDQRGRSRPFGLEDGITLEPPASCRDKRKSMRRIVPLIAVAIALAPACGCEGLGWYRAVGHVPGIAATDYAFYDFCGTSSQLYQLSAPQVESALLESLGDLGFKVLEPPQHAPDGGGLIHAHTPDGRPADITVTPQNRLTN